MSTLRLPIWLSAGLSQIIGAATGFAAAAVWSRLGAGPPEIAVILSIVGVVAALAGHFAFRLPAWWLPINAVFLPALWIGAISHWPAWLFGVLFCLTLAVFWNAIRDRVPLYLSNETTVEAVAEVLNGIAVEGQFCDLGSGTGGFAIRLGARCPAWRVVGYESAPALFVVSKVRAALRGQGAPVFDRHDFWTRPLDTFDVVYAFLSPEPMPALFDKVKREMKPGSVFISNSFEVPGIKPDQVIELTDSRRTRLSIWRIQGYVRGPQHP